MLEFSIIGSSKCAWKAVTLSVILEKSDSIIKIYLYNAERVLYDCSDDPRHLMCADENNMRIVSKLVDLTLPGLGQAFGMD